MVHVPRQTSPKFPSPSFSSVVKCDEVEVRLEADDDELNVREKPRELLELVELLELEELVDIDEFVELVELLGVVEPGELLYTFANSLDFPFPMFNG